MSYCTTCGTQINKKDTFCRACGSNMNRVALRERFNRKTVITILIMIILAISTFIYLHLDKSVEMANFYPFKKEHHYQLEGEYYSKADEKLGDLNIEVNYLGKETKDNKTAYVRNMKVYFNGELLREYQNYYKVNHNNEMIELGRQDEDAMNWYVEPVVIYPAKMEVGKEYSFKDYLLDKDENRSRIVKLKEIKDIKIGDQTFQDCLIIETKYYSNNKLTMLETSYINETIGIIKTKEQYFDSNEDYLILTYKQN